MGVRVGVRGATITNKMKAQDTKALWAPQTEKPIHYTYETVIVTLLHRTESQSFRKTVIYGLICVFLLVSADI